MSEGAARERLEPLADGEPLKPDVRELAAPLRGKSILLLPRYTRSGPSSRLRMLQFVPLLEQAGARVETAPLFGEEYLRAYFSGSGKKPGLVVAAYLRRLARIARGGRYDLIWIEKELFPFLPGLFERLVRRLGTRWVVDYDDAIFHNYDGRRLLADKLRPLIGRSAAITAGNEYLEEYARSRGAQRVVRIPTVVDPSRYPVRATQPGAPVRIGWIGTPANAAYLRPVAEALSAIGRTRAIELVTIGAPPIEGLSVPQVSHLWSEGSEAELLSTIDIGVMPLPDAPWERGKCGYKLIQYMAAGKPVIASPVGVNVEIVTPEVGFLATSPEEWRVRLLSLIDQPVARRQMGSAGRRRVETEFSSEVVGRRLVALFAQICA